MENTHFPPTPLLAVYQAIANNEAWWTGAIAEQSPRAQDAYETGVFQRLRNYFWGRETQRTTSRADIHVPLASTICETSAQLLYGTPPTLTAQEETTPTSDRVNQYIENGLFTQLVEGAEIGAALGGRYHRVTWDATQQTPFITTVHPARVIPTFTWGNLTKAIIHTVLPGKTDATTVYRHLETHYLDAFGNGRIRHELYKGSSKDLGTVVPLSDHPDTAPLADLVDENAEIPDGITPGLNIVYFPNITPNRVFYNNPYGKHLGRSDLDQLHPLLDALDEVWNSWLRDVRLGKSRIIVPRSMLLDRNGNRYHNLDQETYEGLETPGDPTGNNSITNVQFNIRHLEHMNTVQELTQEIIHAAGYSTSTFGEQDSVAITATEVRSREKATLTTRDRKIRLEQPALETLLRKLLAVDASVFNTPGLNADAVEVKFPNIAVDTPEALARIASQLAGAGVASLTTIVTLLHPDWDVSAVETEVQAIREERATVLDPVDFHPYPTVDENEPGGA